MDIDQNSGGPVEESQAVHESRKKQDLDTITLPASDTASGYFDCNICLDFAQDPVVTLCGHLYCWACIYKWLSRKNATPQQCPVCKSALSQTTMVPLYGRGNCPRQTDHETKHPHTATTLDIPNRPSAYRPQNFLTHSQQELPQHQYPNDSQYNQPPTLSFGGTTRFVHPTGGAFGGMAIAVLPWVFGFPEAGLYYSNPYYSMGSLNSPRLRRQQMQAERSLGRISAFLFCCVILCLLLF